MACSSPYLNFYFFYLCIYLFFYINPHFTHDFASNNSKMLSPVACTALPESFSSLKRFFPDLTPLRFQSKNNLSLPRFIHPTAGASSRFADPLRIKKVNATLRLKNKDIPQFHRRSSITLFVTCRTPKIQLYIIRQKNMPLRAVSCNGLIACCIEVTSNTPGCIS